LNHASIIDGIRLCKAKRYRYRHNDIDDLREQLREAVAAGSRYKLVFTDGVFSMDGTYARLDEIRAVCDEFGAMLGVDLGKALGGASGGFTSARSEVVDLLRQRSRPYLFSNTVAPPIVGATLQVLHLLEADTCLRDNLEENARYLRAGLTGLGFDLKEGSHPIIPVMVRDAELSQRLAQRLLELGVYVVGFFYPVVPKGQARIRVQVSAQHTRAQLDTALNAFKKAGRELGVTA
jgi:glycine C-acetyltransferase